MACPWSFAWPVAGARWRMAVLRLSSLSPWYLTTKCQPENRNCENGFLSMCTNNYLFSNQEVKHMTWDIDSDNKYMEITALTWHVHNALKLIRMKANWMLILLCAHIVLSTDLRSIREPWNNFWGHPVWGSNERFAFRQVLGNLCTETKVRQLYLEQNNSKTIACYLPFESYNLKFIMYFMFKVSWHAI